MPDPHDCFQNATEEDPVPVYLTRPPIDYESNPLDTFLVVCTVIAILAFFLVGDSTYQGT